MIGTSKRLSGSKGCLVILYTLVVASLIQSHGRDMREKHGRDIIKANSFSLHGYNTFNSSFSQTMGNSGNGRPSSGNETKNNEVVYAYALEHRHIYRVIINMWWIVFVMKVLGKRCRRKKWVVKKMLAWVWRKITFNNIKRDAAAPPTYTK